MHIVLAVPHLSLCEPAAVDITLIYGWCERITVLRIGSSERFTDRIERFTDRIERFTHRIERFTHRIEHFTHRIHMGDTQLSDRDLTHFMH